MSQRVRSRRRSKESKNREEVTNAISLPPTEAFEVFGNDRRRAAISVLTREGEVRSVRALARTVAADEHGIAAAHVTERQHKCVYVSLLQIHLPRLAEEGLIEWEGSEGPIAARGSIAALAGVIDLFEEACGESGGEDGNALDSPEDGPIP
jgi:hypothetical protein